MALPAFPAFPAFRRRNNRQPNARLPSKTLRRTTRVFQPTTKALSPAII